MPSQFIAAAASVALVGAGFASIEGTRSSEVLPMKRTTLMAEDAGSGSKCRVDVVRSGVAGTADITRHVTSDGTCVCTVTTGETSGNGAAENIVTNLLGNRSCDGAPAPASANGGANAGANGGTNAGGVAGAGAGGGGSSAVLPLLLTTVGAAGLAVAIGKDSKG